MLVGRPEIHLTCSVARSFWTKIPNNYQESPEKSQKTFVLLFGVFWGIPKCLGAIYFFAVENYFFAQKLQYFHEHFQNVLKKGPLEATFFCFKYHQIFWEFSRVKFFSQFETPKHQI